MKEVDKDTISYCRKCGGERHHSVFAEKNRRWKDGEAPIDGSDTWSILECGGCHTVTFVHSHWFSEDVEYNEDGPSPIVHRELYPPAPKRKMPEWMGADAYVSFSIDDLWIIKLHEDIYAAIGLEAYALAAMGMRTIVDFVVTSKAGDRGRFDEKLERMHEQNLLTQMQVAVMSVAFDAGSAAAHRGYSPTQEDVYTLLDITEALLEHIYISPTRRNQQAKAAAALKAKTPRRRPR